MDHPLDNVVWNALRGPQAALAEWDGSGRAVRFDPEVSLFTATDKLGEQDWAAQAELVGHRGLTVLFRNEVPKPPAGWLEVFRAPTWQLIADDLDPVPEVSVERLGVDDIDEMLELTGLTEPGPFLRRTVELGTYVGVRERGRMIAMAGERFKVRGFTEVSAVCTHPDARRQGHGSALTLWVAHNIRERGDEAFLHVLKSNESALRLYESIGFRRRRSVDSMAAIWNGSPAS